MDINSLNMMMGGMGGNQPADTSTPDPLLQWARQRYGAMPFGTNPLAQYLDQQWPNQFQSGANTPSNDPNLQALVRALMGR
jgi:hypothetical protein